MAFVELVQYYGGDALKVWIRDQATCQYAFGDEPQARVRSTHFVKPDSVPDRFTNPFANFRGDPSRSHSCGNTAWFEHKYLAAYKLQKCGRHTGRLARTRCRLDHKVRRTLQGCNDFRQNFIYRKNWFSAHQFSSNHAAVAASICRKYSKDERMNRRIESQVDSPQPDRQKHTVTIKI
jgi:hypothetical protein